MKKESMINKEGLESKAIEEMVKEWFESRMRMKIRATKNKRSMDIMLVKEGDKRRLDLPTEADKHVCGFAFAVGVNGTDASHLKRIDGTTEKTEADDSIYKEIEHLCGFEMGLDETLDVLKKIEALGFTLD